MNLTVNGRQVTVDDGFRDLPREEQEAVVDRIAEGMPSDAPQPSGILRGAAHGASELVEGVKETGKRVMGIGSGRTKEDAGYVPADVFKPSVSGYGQIVAQSAPGLIADVGAGAAGARIGKTFGAKGTLLGALIGAGLSGFTRTAGDTVKEATEARTGDANSEQTSGDTARGVATAAAANAAGALLPTRFIPGMNNVTGVGAKGISEAAKRWAGTTALGGVGSGVSDVITQAGTTAGTDKGLTVDPERALRAAAEGSLTAGTLSTPKAATDAGRAAGMSKFGGENEAASHAVATRLEAAAEKGLGKGKNDAAAFGIMSDDLKTELRGTAKNIDGLSPEATNALERVQSGKNITAKEVSLLERETSNHPDGANAGFLARQMFVAQQLQKRGSYSEGQWSGGISGAMDSRISRMLNPVVVGTGIGGTMLGAHFAGMMAPAFLGGATGLYLGARVLDSATGMRSPASTFAQHFADRQQQVRMQPTQQQAAPAAPDAAATAQADANYKAMVQQAHGENDQRDANYKANVEQAFSENAARNAALLDATKQDNANLKANVSQALSENTARDKLATLALKQRNADFKANQVQAGSENTARDKAEKDARTASEKAQAKAEKAAKAAETAVAKAALAKARVEQQAVKDAAKVEAAKVKAAAAAVKATKITKAKGEQPKVEAPPPPPEAEYSPIPESELTRKGVPFDQVVQRELEDYNPAMRKVYGKVIRNKRDALVNNLEPIANNASDADSVLVGKLYHELDHIRASKPHEARRSIKFWTAKMAPETRAAVENAIPALMRHWKE